MVVALLALLFLLVHIVLPFSWLLYVCLMSSRLTMSPRKAVLPVFKEMQRYSF